MQQRKKILDVQDVADLLQISVVKVQRWIHQGIIPCKVREGRFCFRRREVLEWARMHDFQLGSPAREAPKNSRDKESPLSQAVKRGGVVFDLEGGDIYCVLKAAVSHMHQAMEMDANRVLEELLSREELASTGIGHGIAIPHPRHMPTLTTDSPRVPVFFLKQPIDFAAVDGRPVDILFTMFSPDTHTHLDLLSRLGYLLRRDSFPADLRRCRTAQEVVQCIRDGENHIRAGSTDGNA